MKKTHYRLYIEGAMLGGNLKLEATNKNKKKITLFLLNLLTYIFSYAQLSFPILH